MFFLAEDIRTSVALCKPTPAMHSHLHKIVQQLTQPTMMDKPGLFIKPFDLVDGVMRLSLGGPRKDRDKDVVSKGMLVRRGPSLACLRCGGKSEVGTKMDAGYASVRWRAWESMWTLRCICGGSWVSGTFQ